MQTEQEREFLKQLAAVTIPGSVAELRSMQDQTAVMLNADLPQIGALHEDVELRPGLSAEVAVPAGAGPHPVVVYLHGGGWVAGSPRTHRKLAMRFAEAGYLTINVDYRLAPEHPFPAGFDDSLFAIKWAGENARRWNGDATRLAVGGDSAGANLTAAALLALSAERNSGPNPRAAILIYGVYDFGDNLRRIDQAAVIEMLSKAYLGERYPAAIEDPRVSPIRAIRPGALPASFVICGTADPLLGQTSALAEAFQRSNIPHELQVIDSMPHGFMQMEMLSGCVEGLRLMFNFLERMLSETTSV